jgi:hypothetical protein
MCLEAAYLYQHQTDRYEVSRASGQQSCRSPISITIVILVGFMPKCLSHTLHNACRVCSVHSGQKLYLFLRLHVVIPVTKMQIPNALTDYNPILYVKLQSNKQRTGGLQPWCFDDPHFRRIRRAVCFPMLYVSKTDWQIFCQVGEIRVSSCEMRLNSTQRSLSAGAASFI